MHQGVPDGMPEFRQQGRYDGAGRSARRAVARARRAQERRRVRSAGRGWNERNLRAARRDQSRSVRRAARESARAAEREAVEGAAQVARQPGDDRRADRRHDALLAVRAQEGRTEAGRTRMLLRYTLLERAIHWVAALAYMYVLATGLAFYSPHL